MTSLSDFVIYEELGSGAYSKVNKIKRKDDDQAYALKRVFLSKLSEKEKENALNEVRILASVSSENVVSYKEAFWDNNPSALCIVMEYADGGDLYERIKKHKKAGTRFKEEEIWNIFIQVVKGLKVLHSNMVLHRDLKWANVFLNKDGTVKLGDLNVSKVAKMGLVYTQTGTPYYASPEVWQDKPYDSKSDIWSLGVVLYEMCTLNPPFTDTSMKGLCKKVLKGTYPSIPSVYSKDLSSMIQTLIQVSPSKRPSWNQILHMPALEEHLPEEDTYEISQELLNTIKFPRNIHHLNNRLPKSQYANDSDFSVKEPVSEKKELYPKNSQPIIPIEKYSLNHSEELKREIDKYEAIAEIERKYTQPDSSRTKKQRQIPKTTPSSINGIPEIYSKYKNKARIIAASLKQKEEIDEITRKQNYLNLKEKYLKRAKEVEEIEKRDKILLHKRIANNHNVSSDAYQPVLYSRDRKNYHISLKTGRNQAINNHMNSKSEDYREESKYNKHNNLLKQVHNYKAPETSKAMDNLSIDDSDSRKARILQHAREIREAVSLNREKATGMVLRVADNSAVYVPAIPKWWG